jgi:peptide subunit release factor 1 (eRF1)
LKEAARFMVDFLSEQRVRRVLVGGTEANVARFINLLPKTWQSLVMGTFPIEMTAGHAQVLEKAMAVAQKAVKKNEARLVSTVITAAAKGQEGVIRLDDTLGAVHAGQVQTLIISEGHRAPGYRCMGCSYLTAQALEICPFCGDSIEKIEDAIEMAVRKVFSDGGEVEVIHDNSDLEKAGGIGALLRY